MKKAVTFMCIAALLLSVSLSVSAAEGTDYSFPDYQLTVTVPTSWTVYERSTAADKVDAVGPSCFIVAYPTGSQDTEMQLLLSADSDSATAYNWKQLEEQKLNPFADNKPVTDMLGMEALKSTFFTTYSKYRSPQALFLKLSGKQDADGTVKYVTQYSTVVNGKSIVFKMTSDAPISSKTAKELKGVVKSSAFDDIPSLPDDVVAHAQEVMTNNKIHMRNMFWYFSASQVLVQTGILALLYLFFPLFFMLRKRALSTYGCVSLQLIIAGVLIAAQLIALNVFSIRITGYELFIPAILWSVVGYFLLAISRKQYIDESKIAEQEAWDAFYRTHPAEKPVSQQS